MKRSCGLTLVELVLVLALVGILLGVAAPGYQHYVIRAHRAEAVTRLLRVAACQERLRTVAGRYDTRACLPASDARYAYTYAGPSGGEGLAYTAIARPLGRQAGDACGELRLDHTGLRTVGATETDPARCWSGR